MCLCYFMQRIDKIKKYIGNEAVKENITGKHINTTSLIRSSPNTLGLRLLVQPSMVSSLLCFQSRVFTTVSLIWVSLNRYKSVRPYLDPPSLWSTQTLLTETRPLLVTVVWAQSETHTWQAYIEEFTWTSQAFSGVHRLSDSLWLCLAQCCLCFCKSSRLCLSSFNFLCLTNSLFCLLCLC